MIKKKKPKRPKNYETKLAVNISFKEMIQTAAMGMKPEKKKVK